jgi:pheromone shutdown protein TraB
MPENKIDLNEFVQSQNQNLKFSLTSVEDTAERESRLRIAEADALHLRSKELLIYRLTASILIGVVVLCFWIILNKGLSNDEGKLALALLTSIVTGLVGYVTGKSAK